MRQRGKSATAADASFWKRWAPLFGAGMAGVAALGPGLRPLIEKQRPNLPPSLRDMSDARLIVLSSIQPAVLVAAAAAAGVALAPSLGFHSHLVAAAAGDAALPAALAPEVPLAAAVGAGCGLVVLGLDRALRPSMPAELRAFVAQQPRTIGTTVSGLLYGGISEEILMRWGLMTVFVWAGTRAVGDEQSEPRPAVVSAAIALTALLFGAGHLPVAAKVAPLTAPLVARTLVLNGIFGVATGWLYWRRSLEAAMVAHAMGHVVFALAALAAEEGS